MTLSRGSVTCAKMNAPIIILCCLLGSGVSYNVNRDVPYNIGPNDPFDIDVNSNLGVEPSQRIFWGNGGSNQVGGDGSLWSKITNKFPFLENIFGRMELPTEYGVPNVQQQYGLPVIPQQHSSTGRFQTQFYQGGYQQRYVPSARDVAFTDDAVIITPPHVPIAPQPEPQPLPQPTPLPEPSSGYHYNKPQYRLELPHK